MSIKLIFEICEDFFDFIYSQGIDNLHDVNKKVDLDEEIGIEDDEDECYCNACCISRHILSVLNHYKRD